MKKGIYISKLLSSILTTILLIYFFIKTPNGKVILIPFLICSISILLKYIFLLFNKEKYINIVNKLFVIGFLSFWFGFLIYLTYRSIIDKEYSLIIFSVPFWLVGIKLIEKLFLKKDIKKQQNKKM